MSKETPSKRLKLEENEVMEPILADYLTNPIPLINVYVGTIKNPKSISSLIKVLNTMLPIEELKHLKRVKNQKVILQTIKKAPNLLHLLDNINFDRNLLENEFETVAVAEIAPKTRKQFEETNSKWPCNFHPNLYLEKLTTNTLFTSSQLNVHQNYMKITLEIAKLTRMNNATLVIDSKTESIVAFGYSQADKCPIWHSVMVAIDNVAKTQNGGQLESDSRDKMVESEVRIKFPEVEWGCGVLGGVEGPYLCTNYSVYTVHEPCITCGMALVHSRAKRVFYGAKSTFGGLGTLCKLHTVEALNHHYEVFGGLLQTECEQIHFSARN